MHIPLSSSQELSIESFSEALDESHGSVLYDAVKWILIPPRYDEYRYVLGTNGNHPLICCGINPSTAMPDALDNTLKSVEKIALHNGFDSFLMFNVYAQRATKPDDMDRERNDFLHQENMKAFRFLLERCQRPPVVWAAWGAIIEKRAYLCSCIKEMFQIGKEYQTVWMHAGKQSKNGHPHHPLYLRSDSLLMPFPVEEYFSNLSKSNIKTSRTVKGKPD